MDCFIPSTTTSLHFSVPPHYLNPSSLVVSDCLQSDASTAMIRSVTTPNHSSSCCLTAEKVATATDVCDVYRKILQNHVMLMQQQQHQQQLQSQKPMTMTIMCDDDDDDDASTCCSELDPAANHCQSRADLQLLRDTQEDDLSVFSEDEDDDDMMMDDLNSLAMNSYFSEVDSVTIRRHQIGINPAAAKTRTCLQKSSSRTAVAPVDSKHAICSTQEEEEDLSWDDDDDDDDQYQFNDSSSSSSSVDTVYSFDLSCLSKHQ